VLRGHPHAIRPVIDVLVVDDDVGGPYPPPSREPFLEALRLGGAEVRRAETASGESRASLVLALFGDIRAWKGRPGYSDATRAAVADAYAAAARSARDMLVVQFSHPRLASQIPEPRTVLCAWGGDSVMQQAAARWLVKNK